MYFKFLPFPLPHVHGSEIRVYNKCQTQTKTIKLNLLFLFNNLTQQSTPAYPTMSLCINCCALLKCRHLYPSHTSTRFFLIHWKCVTYSRIILNLGYACQCGNTYIRILLSCYLDSSYLERVLCGWYVNTSVRPFVCTLHNIHKYKGTCILTTFENCWYYVSPVFFLINIR